MKMRRTAHPTQKSVKKIKKLKAKRVYWDKSKKEDTSDTRDI